MAQYGVAIAGEAHLVIGIEDVVDDLVDQEAGFAQAPLPPISISMRFVTGSST